MSWKNFEDNCPGCQPVILDRKTMKPFPHDSPVMQAVMRVWQETTLQERQAFHDFMCNNSREPLVMGLVNGLHERFQLAISATDN